MVIHKKEIYHLAKKIDANELRELQTINSLIIIGMRLIFYRKMLQQLV